MLILVEVRTKTDKLLSLPLQDPSSGIYIKSIEGLDPVKANIVSSSFAMMDGEQYQASRREKRNIVMKLGMDPDFVTNSVRSLRSHLYGFFMPKSEVRMRFYDSDNPFVMIYGRVESFEAPIFTKEPEATISLLCMNPDFYMPTPVVFGGNSVSSSTETVLDYIGTVDTGFVFQISIGDNIDGFEIHNRTLDNVVRSLVIEYDLLEGDVVKISTVPGSKYVNLMRGGVETSILYSMSPVSTWIGLDPGINNIRVVAEGDPHPYTITYTNKFGGL